MHDQHNHIKEYSGLFHCKLDNHQRSNLSLEQTMKRDMRMINNMIKAQVDDAVL